MDQMYLTSNDAYTELTAKIIRSELNRQQLETYKVLDFSAEQYSLLRIGIFQTLSDPIRDQIMEINVSNNRLIQIDQINAFKNIVKLDIHNNHIKSLELTSPCLTHIDASYNKIQDFPNLSPLTKLTHLNLSGNLLTDLYVQNIEGLSEIIEFNISSNQIKFKRGSIIKAIIQGLKKLKNLLNLDFSLNPFEIQDDTIWIYFVVVLDQLKMLNKKSIEQMTNDKNRILQQNKKKFDLTDLDWMEFEENSDYEWEEEDGQHKDLHIFEKLNNRLEICLKDPSQITDQLKTLTETVESIVSTQPDKWQEIFSSDDLEENNKIEQQLDNFLQNCFLLCQNQQNYIKEVLVILIQFAIIPHRQFGKRCFQQFVEVIKSGRGMAKIAKDLLHQYSVPQIQRHEKLQNVPSQVMEGIVRCIQERPESVLVPVELVDNFARWLGQTVLNYKNKNDKVRNEQLNIDLILLSLVDELAKNSKYVKNYRKHNISKFLLIIFKFMLKRNFLKHQIKILSTMESIFMFDRQTSFEVLSLRNETQNFVKDLEDELGSNIFMFKQCNNSMINPETKENREYIQLKYDIFEALIRCYAALMYWNKYDLIHYKKDVLMNEMMSLCTVTGLHPKLLNGLVLFIIRLLENEYMIKSKVSSDYVAFIGNGIQNGTLFIQYLGGTSYIPMMKQLGDNQHVSMNLINQINPIIQDLFKNIVNLIGFFSLKSINQTSNISGICSEISMQLNKNNREDALFLTLATPNDNVRLAIVQCLLTIKTDQLDTKEVSHLIGLLPMYSNLGAGKTEAIISNIMMILTKIICSNKQLEIDRKSKTKVLHDFITIYSENAIKDSLGILVKNMERDLRLDPEENFEKMELAVGVVNFLKSMGMDEELRRNLKGFEQAKYMKISLILEEKFVDPHLVSVEIERTWIGKYCEHLLMALCGKESVFPFGKVWERIFIRIAENLEGKDEDIPEDLNDLNGIYNSKRIIHNITNKNTKRTDQNLDIWDVMKVGLNKVVRKWDDKSKQSKEYKYLENQHKLFAESEAVYNLLYYTLGRNQNTEAMELEQYFRKQIHAMLNFDKQVKSIRNFINEALKDQIDLMDPKRNQTKPKPKLTKQVEQFQNILNVLPSPFDPLRGSNLEPPHMSSLVLKPLTKVSRTIKQVRGRLDHHPDENEMKYVIVPSQRIITVSAYLRIVYSMLVFSPLKTSSKMVADQIAESLEYLKELTFICQWAQWGEGNIASKYLKIVNVVLDLSITCRKNQFIKGYLIISKVLQTVLNIVEFKLNDDDKCPQTIEDKILISEICECMGRIITNIKHISFDDDIRSQAEIVNFMGGKGFDILQKISIASHEYFLTLIMPLKSFKIYLLIMTWDMRVSQGMSKDQIADNDSQEVMKTIRKWLEYVLGAYIMECQSIRKEITQQIVEFEVFHKQYIRYSFIQGFLDMRFNVLFQEKLRQQLNDTIFGSKNNDQSTSNQIIFQQRCFLQDKHNGSFTQVVLLLLETSLLIIQVHEIINHKEDINSANFITIKSHKVLLRVPTDQIDALYQMESMQRVVLVYQPKVKGPYTHDDGLQASIIFMREIDAISSLIDEARRLSITISSDYISVGSIKKFLVDKPIVLLWCVRDPSQPLLDRHSEFTSNKMCLVAVLEKKIVVLHDHLEEWYWTDPKRFTVQSTLSSKQRGFKNAKELRDRTVANLFYVEKKDYPFDKLSTIRMEQSLNSVITLYFGKDKLTLLLGCDTAREHLKKALIQCVGEIDSFQVHNKQLI